jgi:hypothetical protein
MVIAVDVSALRNSTTWGRTWKDAYATLGGWHMGWPDDDWHDLLDAKLLVHTYMDSEPWVEAWQLPFGAMKVIQRIT